MSTDAARFAEPFSKRLDNAGQAFYLSAGAPGKGGIVIGPGTAALCVGNGGGYSNGRKYLERMCTVKRKPALFGCAVALFCLIGGCSGDEGARSTRRGGDGGGAGVIDSNTVAVVNGRSITKQEVDRQEQEVRNELLAKRSPMELEGHDEEIRKRATDKVIDRVLLEVAAEREGIRIPPEDVESQLAQLMSNFPSEMVFDEQLAQNGFTRDSFRKQLEVSLGITVLVDKHVGVVAEPDEDECKKYYDENLLQFWSPELVKASHILLRVEETDSESEKVTKRLRLEGILEEARQGGDFAELAEMYSEGPSAPKGGDLGFFKRGTMVKPFEEAAFALEIGEVSGVVETSFGFHIIKVTDRQTESYTPFDEVKKGIGELITKQRYNKELTRYISGLREAAEIEYADPALAGKP